MSRTEITLTVKEADPNLVGKKIIALDIDSKKSLGLVHGDFVE